jgi:hypothetical protein
MASLAALDRVSPFVATSSPAPLLDVLVGSYLHISHQHAKGNTPNGVFFAH